jgi:hypothetical protein
MRVGEFQGPCPRCLRSGFFHVNAVGAWADRNERDPRWWRGIPITPRRDLKPMREPSGSPYHCSSTPHERAKSTGVKGGHPRGAYMPSTRRASVRRKRIGDTRSPALAPRVQDSKRSGIRCSLASRTENTALGRASASRSRRQAGASYGSYRLCFLLRGRSRRAMTGTTTQNTLVSTHVTKSRYMAGLQCLRRLWLPVHEPPPYEEPPPAPR